MVRYVIQNSVRKSALFFQFFEILLRTTDRTEKKITHRYGFWSGNVSDQVTVRTKFRTTYGPDFRYGPVAHVLESKILEALPEIRPYRSKKVCHKLPF